MQPLVSPVDADITPPPWSPLSDQYCTGEDRSDDGDEDPSLPVPETACRGGGGEPTVSAGSDATRLPRPVRSTRGKLPQKLSDYDLSTLMAEASSLDDPSTYEEAMSSSDKEEWCKAIKYHESRTNSYRAQDDEAGPSESTPLIHRFPPNSLPRTRGPATTAIISLLLLILLSGVVIGIYLLVVQNSSENILPPVESSLMYVGRVRWDNGTHLQLAPQPASPAKAKYVVVVQTDTRMCNSYGACFGLLHEMQDHLGGKELPYNFLVSSSGQVFEATSWKLSALYPQYPRALVLAFIGNFTETSPSLDQMTGAEKFFSFSVSRQHLVPDFLIVGNDTEYSPKYLYQSLQKYPQWANSAIASL